MLTKAMALLIAIPALYAQPAPTRIGQHAMGETLKEWLTTEKLTSQDEACAARLDFYQIEGSRATIEALQKSFDKLERERVEKECREDKEAGIVTVGNDFGDKQFKWKFSDQKLVSLEIVMPAYILSAIEPDVPQELKFLTDAYGPPAETKTVSYQNSYGAKWDTIQAYWVMPDATRITALETIRSTVAQDTAKTEQRIKAIRAQTAAILDGSEAQRIAANESRYQDLLRQHGPAAVGPRRQLTVLFSPPLKEEIKPNPYKR